MFSLDSVEEDTDQPWFSLIQNFSYDQLGSLKVIFRDKCIENKNGLNREEFLEAISLVYGNARYSLQSLILFDEINKENKPEITWNDFLDFAIENLSKDPAPKVKLQVTKIEAVSHTKRETVVKIVLIETEKYFCYTILCKHGKIGLYDGNLNFLTSYHVLMTREDISRNEEERRRRNRWVTDAVFCPDVLMLIVTNTARSIMVYEVSGLKHVPCFLVLSTPNIVQCLEYRCMDKDAETGSFLYMGDSNGELSSFHFLQPKISLFRKKHNDKMSLFYWTELPDEKQYVIYKRNGKLHKDGIKCMKYFKDNGTIFTCSRDLDKSVVKQYIGVKRKPYVFKMQRGANTFALSRVLKLLITGSDDGTIRIWNPVIVSKPIATIAGHQSGVVDLEIMEAQETFLSCSRDGMLKLWDITEHKCLQVVKIAFPSFGIEGKLIEWGTNSLYPGPKRHKSEVNENNEGSYDIKEVGEDKTTSENEASKLQSFNKWSRSNILVTCCNYIATIRLKFSDTELEKSFEKPILRPPPLQNSVLIPSSWKFHQVNVGEGSKRFPSPPQEQLNIDGRIDDLKFILEKDILGQLGLNSDINHKIAKLEQKKLQMKHHVSQGAPYLALDLYEIEEVKLSESLPFPDRGKAKILVENTQKILADASHKDQIFSEPSSSVSRSSRSSVVEFSY